MQKITNLSRQIEKINLDFLETNIMDRAHILNFAGQEKNETQADANMTAQTTMQDSSTDNKVVNSTSDLPITPHRIFPVYQSALLHVLGLYYTLPLTKTNHLDLVRGADPSESWDRSAFFSKEWNVLFGFGKPDFPLSIKLGCELEIRKTDHNTKYRLESLFQVFAISELAALALTTDASHQVSLLCRWIEPARSDVLDNRA